MSRLFIDGHEWVDISDRATRLLGMISTVDGPYTDLGVIYGWRERDYGAQALQFSRPLGLLNTPIPWWSHHPWGRVLMLDDFEDTLKWKQGGGTVTKASDAGFVHDGASAMKMVTGGAAGNSAFADLWCTPIKEDSDYIVLEFYWALTAAGDATPRDFYVTWMIEDQWLNIGSTFGIRYLNYDSTVVKRKLQYWDSTGAWHDIAGGGLRINIVSPQFNYWCLILKRTIAGGYTYEGFQMNDSLFILTGTAGQAGAFARPAQNIMFVATTDVAVATTAYVDDFVLMDEVQYEL